MCAIIGWEYAPRWDLPFSMQEAASVQECAQLCEADPACTGATYIDFGTAQLNCWLKSWGDGSQSAVEVPPPCRSDARQPRKFQALFSASPAGAACSGVTYMDSPVYSCTEEALTEQVCLLGLFRFERSGTQIMHAWSCLLSVVMFKLVVSP